MTLDGYRNELYTLLAQRNMAELVRRFNDAGLRLTGDCWQGTLAVSTTGRKATVRSSSMHLIEGLVALKQSEQEFTIGQPVVRGDES
jgi:hypothetical protein